MAVLRRLRNLRTEGAVDGHPNVHGLKSVSTQPSNARGLIGAGNVAGRNCGTRCQSYTCRSHQAGPSTPWPTKSALTTGTGSGRCCSIVRRAQGSVAQPSARRGSLVVSNNIGCRCRSGARLRPRPEPTTIRWPAFAAPVAPTAMLSPPITMSAISVPALPVAVGLASRSLDFGGTSERQRVTVCGRQGR